MQYLTRTRLLEEKIASVQAEKNKERNEVRSAFEEALCQADLVFEIELTLLRDRIVNANDRVQSMRATYAREVKLERKVVLLQMQLQMLITKSEVCRSNMKMK